MAQKVFLCMERMRLCTFRIIASFNGVFIAMKRKLLLVFVCSFICSIAFEQSLATKQISALDIVFHLFLRKAEKTSESDLQRERPSEYLICFLSIDSSGSVTGFHILSDDANKDSTYRYLSRMTAADFK